MPIDATIVRRKLPIIVPAISPPYIELYCNLSKIPPTTLKRIIATASLTIPSPKIIENNFGNFIESIRVNAATESVAEIVALYLTIRLVSRCS